MRLIGALGVGEVPSSEESSDCLLALNQLIASWNVNAIMIYAQDEIRFPAIASKNIYTIGEDPTADIVAVRPDKILRAYREESGYSTELSTIENAYYQTLNPSYEGLPNYVYYNPTYPLGTLHLLPIPQGGWDIRLSVFHKIKELLSIDDDIDAPPNYLRALAYNLAIEIAPEFGMNINDAVLKSASDSLQNIKRMNTKTIVSLIECGNDPIIQRTGYGTDGF